MTRFTGALRRPAVDSEGAGLSAADQDLLLYTAGAAALG
jgi:hypothetical protein